MPNPVGLKALAPAQERRRRRRNLVLALPLCAVTALVYVFAIARLGPHVFPRLH
jgi:hypothetical protein